MYSTKHVQSTNKTMWSSKEKKKKIPKENLNRPFMFAAHAQNMFRLFYYIFIIIIVII